MSRFLVATLSLALAAAIASPCLAGDDGDFLMAGQRVVHAIPHGMLGASGKKGTLLNTDFTHRYFEPEEKAGDETLVLLHGSGGDEMSLVEMARQIAPQAKLLAVRGRIVQDGVLRWYKRITPVSFDQTDIRAQADAFAAFLRKAVEAGTIDLGKTTFLGYSNGANLIGALTLMHPDLVHRAVLLRAMPVLDDTPSADLSKARFLTVAGEQDELYSPFAPKLAGLLEDHGASVQARTVKTGHLLGDDDVKVVTEWLASGDEGDKAIR